MPLTDSDTAPRHRALIAAHAAVVLFGFAALFAQWLALSPVAIVLGRTIVAAVTLALIRQHLASRIGRPDLRLAASGVVLALHWIAFFAAIQMSSVAVGLLGYASFPLFTLVLEVLFLRRLWTARDAIVTALVVIGLVLVVPRWSIGDAAVQGLAWGVVSGFAFALLAVMNRAESARRPALDIALWQNAAAAACLLPFALPLLAQGTLTGRDLVLILLLGVLCTALAHTLFISSLRAVSAHTASVIAALEPVYGMLLAWLLLGELPSAKTWVGAALLVAAAVVVAPRAWIRVAAARPKER